MPRPERAKLARMLRAVRDSAGLSGSALAERLSWNQSRVSKLETGRQMPSADDIKEWAAAAETDPAELLAQLDRALTEQAAPADPEAAAVPEPGAAAPRVYVILSAEITRDVVVVIR